MEAGTLAVSHKRGSRSDKRNRPLSRYDAALAKAKAERKEVDLVLAADFATPDGRVLDADKTIAAIVGWVDTYAVEFQIEGRTVWISKAFLAGVWVN